MIHAGPIWFARFSITLDRKVDGHKLQIEVLSWRAQWREPALSLFLGIQAFFVFICIPISAVGIISTPALVSVFGLVLMCACLVVAADRAAVISTLAAAVLSISAILTHARFPDQRTAAVGVFAALANLVVVSWVMARAVFGPGIISAHRIRGAIALYLNFGLVCAAAYRIAVLFAPECIHGVRPNDERRVVSTLVYFSFATLTTTGFGDVIPVHPVVRGLAILEGVAGQLYPATLLARIVTLELEHRRSGRDI